MQSESELVLWMEMDMRRRRNLTLLFLESRWLAWPLVTAEPSNCSTFHRTTSAQVREINLQTLNSCKKDEQWKKKRGKSNKGKLFVFCLPFTPPEIEKSIELHFEEFQNFILCSCFVVQLQPVSQPRSHCHRRGSWSRTETKRRTLVTANDEKRAFAAWTGLSIFISSNAFSFFSLVILKTRVLFVNSNMKRIKIQYCIASYQSDMILAKMRRHYHRGDFNDSSCERKNAFPTLSSGNATSWLSPGLPFQPSRQCITARALHWWHKQPKLIPHVILSFYEISLGWVAALEQQQKNKKRLNLFFLLTIFLLLSPPLTIH